MRKKNNNAKWNRVMALLLSGVMVLGSAPVGVLAAEPEVEEVQVEEPESEEVVVGEGEDTTNPNTEGIQDSQTNGEQENSDDGEESSNISISSITVSEEYRNKTVRLLVKEEEDLTRYINIDSNSSVSTKDLSFKQNENLISFENSKDGIIMKAIKSGKDTIIVQANNNPQISVSFNIEVRGLIENVPEKLNLKEDDVKNIEAKGYSQWKSGDEIIDEFDKLLYESSNTEIATIDQSGSIKAIKEGTTSIRVYYNPDNKQAGVRCTITVSHNWESIPEWSEDNKTCKITLKCKKHKEVQKTVEGNVISEEKKGSCTKKGGILYTASVPEYDIKEEKFVSDGNLADHSLKLFQEKTATCEADGNYEYYICEEKNCENYGKHFKDAEGKEIYDGNSWIIEKKEHTFDAGKITTKATATKEGVRTCTCKVCKQKVKYKIPRTAFTYKLGTKSGCIVSKVSDFKSIQLPTDSSYSTTKKAFTLDTKNWILSPTKNAYKYYKSMKTFIPLTVTTKDGKKSTVKVNFQFPDPEVKITRTYETQAGKGVYRYTFDYDIPGATRIYVRLNTKNTRINNDFISDFKKYIYKPKSDKESYIRVWKSYVDSVGKNGMKFQITAYYGNNKSRTITIAK